MHRKKSSSKFQAIPRYLAVSPPGHLPSQGQGLSNEPSHDPLRPSVPKLWVCEGDRGVKGPPILAPMYIGMYSMGMQKASIVFLLYVVLAFCIGNIIY